MKAVLHAKPNYIPKVPSVTALPVILKAFFRSKKGFTYNVQPRLLEFISNTQAIGLNPFNYWSALVDTARDL